MGSTPIHSRLSEDYLKQKHVQLFLSVVLISQLFLTACTALIPTTDQPTPTVYVRPTATPLPTEEPTEALVSTKTPVPTIAITDKLLKGLNITVRHPFYDSIEEFDQMVRDFNLNNLWGIHVTGMASGGTEGLKNDLNDGLVEDDLVIGMDYDLLAAQPDTQILALDNYARDTKFGVAQFFSDQSPFSELTPQFGESTHYTVPLAYNAGILLYNTTWAEELGFAAAPNSQESLQNLAKAAMEFNQNDDNFTNNGTGGLLLSQSPLSGISWYSSFMGTQQDPDFVPQPEPLLASFYFLKETYDANQSWIALEPLPYRYFSDRFAVVAEGTLESLKHQDAYQGSSTFQNSWTTHAYPGSGNSGRNLLVVEPLSFALQRSDQNSELAAWIFGIWLMEPAQQARLVEMHGLWPSTGNPGSIAPDYASKHPYWAAALETAPIISVVPSTAEWSSKRLVFQDAYQRIYNLDSEYFINIYEVFEQTTQTNQEQRP